MRDVLLSLPGIALTVLCWGAYGTVLHKGQHDLEGNRLKPLICVGVAYFIIAIIVPTIILVMQGKFGGGWTFTGVAWSLTAGAAGALGALGIILALTAGGKPVYVMPLVFGGAPIVNVIVSMYVARIPWREVNPLFYAGMIMVGVGAVTVLVFQPKKKPASHAAVKAPAEPGAKDKAAESADATQDQEATLSEEQDQTVEKPA